METHHADSIIDALMERQYTQSIDLSGLRRALVGVERPRLYADLDWVGRSEKSDGVTRLLRGRVLACDQMLALHHASGLRMFLRSTFSDGLGAPVSDMTDALRSDAALCRALESAGQNHPYALLAVYETRVEREEPLVNESLFSPVLVAPGASNHAERFRAFERAHQARQVRILDDALGVFESVYPLAVDASHVR